MLCVLLGVTLTATGLTVICKVADFVVSAIEVAVTVAVIAVFTEAGALYVAEVVVWPLSVPPPETAHVTPALFESFATVAVMATV
jgi:hypothetical protein